MNEIEYKYVRDFNREELQDLFLSVDWASGDYPDKLVTAMRHYQTVCSAWDGDRLVGLVSVMDDSVMTAYVHYLLVRPEYQHRGIGRRLVEMVKERYGDYLRIVLVSYDEGTGFYESCGFKKAEGAVPMYITELRT